MTGLRYSPLHVTEFCGEMQGKFKVGLARLKKPFDAIYCQKNEAISLVAMCSNRILIGPRKSRHCQTRLERPFSWNENLQGEQN